MRGPYHKYSKETRERVIRAAVNGRDWCSVAEAHDVPYKTAYNWVKNRDNEPPRPRGGGTRSKLSPVQVNIILTWLESNPQLTLAAIRDRVELVMNIHVSQQTISNRLDGQLFTTKLIHHEPLGVNTAANKDLRMAYVARLLQLAAANKTIIFIDETNFNLFCRRSCGWSPRGQRSIVQLPNSKGPNLHIIGAISSIGLMYWEKRRGSLKKPDFQAWLRRCLQATVAAGYPAHDIVVVVDNAPAHSQAEAVFQEAEFVGGALVRLAPYSPMLNPIESVWNFVKLNIKAQLQAGFTELMAGDPDGVLTQTEFRLRFLERCVNLAMPLVTPDKCLRACNHVQQHYASALQLEDMPMGE